MSPPLRSKLRPSPAPSPRPPRPSPSPEVGPASAWTPAKMQAVLDGFRSYAQNSARKHGVPVSEVVSLVKDHLLDPEG